MMTVVWNLRDHDPRGHEGNELRVHLAIDRIVEFHWNLYEYYKFKNSVGK